MKLQRVLSYITKDFASRRTASLDNSDKPLARHRSSKDDTPDGTNQDDRIDSYQKAVMSVELDQQPVANTHSSTVSTEDSARRLGLMNALRIDTSAVAPSHSGQELASQTLFYKKSTC